MVSSDYKLNVNFDSDKLTGDKQYEFGVSKGFLDDRLQLSGSFGVENQSIENQFFQNGIKNTHNVRLGTEWRFDRLSIRGGLSKKSTPLK